MGAAFDFVQKAIDWSDDYETSFPSPSGCNKCPTASELNSVHNRLYCLQHSKFWVGAGLVFCSPSWKLLPVKRAGADNQVGTSALWGALRICFVTFV